MSRSKLFVGVDGGGTRTVALVGPRSDAVVARGEAGPANPHAVGFESAAEQLASAVRAALATWPGECAGEPVVEIESAVLGVAGCGRPSDRARLTPLVAACLGVPASVVRVVSDVALLLPAAGLASGVALVAGTGSSAFGVAPGGRTASAGGWGYLLGDDGSAFDVGRRALRAVLRADDGLGPSTMLTLVLKERLGVSQPRDLIRVVYQSPSPRTAIAELAPLVVAVAESDDPIARQIVSGSGEALGRLVRGVARRLALGPDAVVIGTGGLLRAGEPVLGPLRRSLERADLTDFRLLDAEPAVGALRLAARELRMDLD